MPHKHGIKMPMQICECVPVGMHACVCGDHRLMLDTLSFHSPPLFLRQGLLLNTLLNS